MFSFLSPSQCWRCCSLDVTLTSQNPGWQAKSLWCEQQSWVQMWMRLKVSLSATRPLRNLLQAGKIALFCWRSSLRYVQSVPLTYRMSCTYLILIHSLVRPEPSLDLLSSNVSAWRVWDAEEARGRGESPATPHTTPSRRSCRYHRESRTWLCSQVSCRQRCHIVHFLPHTFAFL